MEKQEYNNIITRSYSVASHIPVKPQQAEGFSFTLKILIAIIATSIVAISLGVGLGVGLKKGKAVVTPTEITAIITTHTFKPGCSVTIGTCVGIQCAQVDGTLMCSEVKTSVEISKLCDGITYTVSSAVTCLCDACEFQVITKRIIGTVTNFDGDVVEGVKVSLDGEILDTTTSTGEYGFSHNITTGQSILSLAFTPAISTYMETYKSLNVSGEEAVMTADVILQTVQSTVTFNADNPPMLNLGSNNNAADGAVAEIDFTQGGSVVDSNGNKVTGQVTIQMTSINPNSEKDMDQIPGGMEDEEGDPILAKLMINTNCVLPNGDTCQLKNVAMSTTVADTDEEKNDLYVWTFDSGTNTWIRVSLTPLAETEETKKRKKRATDAVLTTIVNVSPNRWYNLDYYPGGFCYIKSKIYGTNELTKENEALQSYVKSVHRGTSTWLAYRHFYSYDGGICSQVPCDVSGLIKGTYVIGRLTGFDETTLKAANSSQVGFDLESHGITIEGDYTYKIKLPGTQGVDNDGPVYSRWRNCYYGDGKTLKFYSEFSDGDDNYIPFVENYLPYSSWVYNPRFWWGADRWTYEPCYLSIAIYSTNPDVDTIRVFAESSGGNVDVVQGKYFGKRFVDINVNQMVTVANENYYFGIGAVEFKCSGKVFGAGSEIDRTVVKVKLSKKCQLTRDNAGLEEVVTDGSGQFSGNGQNETETEEYDSTIDAYSLIAPEMSAYESMKSKGIFTNHFTSIYWWANRWPTFSKRLTKKNYNEAAASLVTKENLENYINTFFANGNDNFDQGLGILFNC